MIMHKHCIWHLLDLYFLSSHRFFCSVCYTSFFSLFVVLYQEYGNVAYVVDGGFGVYTGNNPKAIAMKVAELVSDPTRLKDMSIKARRLSHPDATKAIAADIAGVLLRKDKKDKK